MKKLKIMLSLMLVFTLLPFKVIHAVPQNIALGKKYTASSLEIVAGQDVSAQKAFDGNNNSRFSAGKMKNIKNQATQQSQWLQVDMGQNSKVDSIVVKFFQKVFATNYEIQTSYDGTNWETVHEEINPDSNETNIVDTIKFESAKQFKRFIRFNFKKVNINAVGNSVSVREIEINGTLIPIPVLTKNIALNKTITTSGVEIAKFTAEKAVDGNFDTRYSSQYMKKGNTPNQKQIQQWLNIDLGASANVKMIKVHFYKKVFATNYVIKTSDQEDGEYQAIATRNIEPDNTTLNYVDTIIFNPTNFKRFVRFDFNAVNYYAAGNGVSVKEIEIFGDLDSKTESVNPIEKLKLATLEIENNNKVVIKNVPADDQYEYTIIGSNNQYVVDNAGNISNHRLEDQNITLLLAARNKKTNELVVESKINKNILIPSMKEEIISGTNPKPKVIPEIQEFKAGEGYLSLENTDTITINDAYKKYADLFNDDLVDILGYKLNYSDDGKIKFIIDEKNKYNLKEEGYLIKIENDIKIYAKEPKAFNMAAVTIAQILQQQNKLPKGIIKDYPTYKIRGMVLDVARIPMRYQFLEKVGKLFRWYKLNEYHIHFNDNQWPTKSRSELASWQETEGAHRIESKKFPSLNKLAFKHDSYEDEYKFYRDIYKNPTYSIEDVKQLQQHLNDYGINILAEFDTPGHSAIYSQYALENPDNIDYLGKPINHPKNLEALALNYNTLPDQSARAKRFVEELIGEYLDNNVFNYEYIHLGVDEYWEKAGNIESFRAYLNSLNAFAKSKGKKLRTWGALNQFKGQTPVDKDIIFDEWAQYESLSDERINEGYRVVNVPQPFTYVTPGRSHKDIINEQYVFDNWDPTLFNANYANKERRAFEAEPLLLGAKGALWGDEHREGIQESDLYFRLEKSMAMIGLKTWKPKTNLSFVEYQAIKESTKLDKTERKDVLVDIQADSMHTDVIPNLAKSNITFTPTNITIVEEAGKKWFNFTEGSYITTNVENINLPYTLEMTIKPKNIETGSLLASDYGMIGLNEKGRSQSDGSVKKGLTLKRYFYAQNIMDKLVADKEYKFSLAATRQVLNVYIDGEKVASFAHQNEQNTTSQIDRNYRTSFDLPFKLIGAGYNGLISNIKVYTKTLNEQELSSQSAEKINIALHKPVYDFRNNSLFYNQNIRPYLGFNMTDGEIDAQEGRWNTSDTNNDYAIIDLTRSQKINEVEVIFDPLRIAQAFNIEVSDDLTTNYTVVKEITNNKNAKLTIPLTEISGKYVKISNLTRSAGKNEVGIKELRVLQNVENKKQLATKFEMKKVNLENEDYLFVKAVVENKLADSSLVKEAMAKLEHLENNKVKVDHLSSLVENATIRNNNLYNTLKFMVFPVNKEVAALTNKTYKLYNMYLQDALTEQESPVTETSTITLDKENEIEAVYYVANDGSLESREFTQTDTTLTFTVDHLSHYAIVEKALNNNHLIGYWNFEDMINSTTPKNLVDNTNNGEFIGTHLEIQPSLLSKSLHFNGASDSYMKVANIINTGTKSYTFSMWLKHDTKNSPAKQTALLQQNKKGRTLLILDNSKTLSTFVNAKKVYSNNAIQANKWQHVTMIYNQATNKIKYIVNGIVEEEKDAGTNQVNQLTDLLVGIHKNFGKDPQPMRGEIDELKLFDTAITDEEAKSLYEEKSIVIAKEALEDLVALMDTLDLEENTKLNQTIKSELATAKIMLVADEEKTAYDTKISQLKELKKQYEVASRKPINIEINKDEVTREIDKNIFGINHRYAFNGYGSFDSATQKIKPEFEALYKKAGFGSIRYPGGTISNLFRWKDTIGAVENRKKQMHGFYNNPNQKGLIPNFGIAEIGTFAKENKSEIVYVYGLGRGSAQDASDLIEFLNAKVSTNPNGGVDWAAIRASQGHPEPFNVRYFEIGNEMNQGGEDGRTSQQYWLPNVNPDKLEAYIEGGIASFTKQYAVTSDSWNIADSPSTGVANQVRYMRYANPNPLGNELNDVDYTAVKPNSVTVYINDSPWTIVEDLKTATATDEVVQINYRTGEILFGDGIHGKIPPKGNKITVSYQVEKDGFHKISQAMRKTIADINRIENEDKKINVYVGYEETEVVPTMKEKGYNDDYDGITIHPYSGTPHGNTTEQFYDDAMRLGIKNGIGRVAPYVNLLPEGKHPVISEFGIFRSTNPLLRSQVHALYIANMALEYIKLGSPYIQKHTLIDWYSSGADSLGPTQQAVIQAVPKEGADLVTGEGKFDFFATPSAHVLEMLSKSFGTNIVNTQYTPPKLFADNVPLYSILSSTDKEGNIYSIIVNLDKENDYEFNLSVKDFDLTNKKINIQKLAPENLEIENTPEEPNKVVIEKEEFVIGASSFRSRNSIFRHSIPKHSVMAIKISNTQSDESISQPEVEVTPQPEEKQSEVENIPQLEEKQQKLEDISQSEIENTIPSKSQQMLNDNEVINDESDMSKKQVSTNDLSILYIVLLLGSLIVIRKLKKNK